MNSLRAKSWAWIFPLVLMLGCTTSEPPKLKELEKQLSAAEESLAKIEDTIKKTPEHNQGLLLKLNQDKQLATSRLERLKENFMAIAPNKKWESKSKETGESGTGGH